LPRSPLAPELILLVFLPMLVFEAALASDLSSLRSAARPIAALALPGVLVSLLATGLIAKLELGLPLEIALLLGALLAITDTVSVLLAFKSVRVPRKLAAIMEGESLFNDGTALVLVSLATVAAVSGHYDAIGFFRGLGLAIVGGGLVGAALAAIATAILRRTSDHHTTILASIVFLFAASLAAERVHASPVIAVVVLGLVIGRAAKKSLPPARLLALHGFWETSGFVINVVLFLFVGTQIEAEAIWREAPAILLALLALHAGRALTVYGSFAALRAAFKQSVPMRWQHVMVAGNMKGALSMAAVLALPDDFPYRERLVTLVFGITLVTLVTQGLPFARLLQWLRVTVEPSDGSIDRARASLISAKRGQRELDDLLEEGLVSRFDHASRRAELQRAVIGAEKVLLAGDAKVARDRLVDVSVLSARKAALLDAERRGLLSPHVADDELRVLDRGIASLAEEKEERL
jgi:CPA1 family monovalent cation:H+ antiporter